MSTRTKDLWTLVDQHHIDPTELADAICDQLAEESLDYRTRLLIRDGVEALRSYWGSQRLAAWKAACPFREKLEAICREDFERVGFPFLKEQVMEPTKPETIRQVLREIGMEISKPVSVALAGAGSLILQGYLRRQTQDLDFIDEVPREIRELGEKLRQIEKQYLLQLGHVQQHYFPSGWNRRVHSQPAFGKLRVDLVDVHDIFLGKLSSIREKDKQDLLILSRVLDKEVLARNFKETCQSFLASEELRMRMEKNWYILFGESLPA